MNELAARQLEKIRRLTLTELQGLPVKIFLFGSQATGTAGRCLISAWTTLANPAPTL